MKLYHFCADKHIRNIMRKGLMIGGIVEFGPDDGYVLHTGWTWLTLEPDPKKQSWATQSIVGYSRTAWRLTVEIPEGPDARIYDRDRLVDLYPGTAQLFDGWPGSGQWRVYRGQIPKGWIRLAEPMEERK